jgi:Eco29kI restriction endonuclease
MRSITRDRSRRMPVAKGNASGNLSKPIYVGKAIPKSGRKGGLAKDVASTGKALLDRLKQHASSISEAENLELEHFFVRHLVVDDIWIPLGENMLIETFQPVWNRVIDGFGNKDPGQRRATRYKSPWDILHPGREFAEKLYARAVFRRPTSGTPAAATRCYNRASPTAVPVVFMLSSSCFFRVL